MKPTKYVQYIVSLDNSYDDMKKVKRFIKKFDYAIKHGQNIFIPKRSKIKRICKFCHSEI